MKNILVISAHPDDETLGAGGTLLKHKSNNDNLYWLIFTHIKEELGFSASDVELRNKEMNDVQIANWLNDNGHKTPRGNTFRNNHVHSIAKKRKRRLEIINTPSTMSISNMNVQYIKDSSSDLSH